MISAWWLMRNSWIFFLANAFIYVSACVYRFNSIHLDIPNIVNYWRCFVSISSYQFRASFLLKINRTLMDKYLPTLRLKIKRTLIDCLLTFIKPSLESTETVPCLTGRKSVVTVQVIIFPEPGAECGVRLPSISLDCSFNRLQSYIWESGTRLMNDEHKSVQFSATKLKWHSKANIYSFGIWEFWIVCMNECKPTFTIDKKYFYQFSDPYRFRKL